MKKVILLIVSVIASITISVAQHGHHGDKKGGMRKDSTHKNMTPEQKATRHSEMLAKKLTLSAEQKQTVYTLIVDRVTKADAVRAKYTGGDKKAMRAEMTPIMQDFNTKFKAVLTPEQTAKWEQLKAERTKKFQDRKKQNPKSDTDAGGPHGDGLDD